MFGKYATIMISVSGGGDSDIMIDIIEQAKKKYNFTCKIHYVFFDTGIEYSATKEHLDFLEKKYALTIERIRAKIPVPLGCMRFGLPFLSKDISAKINSLQNNNFDFKNDGNKPFEELIKKYGKCSSAIKWWCNKKVKGYGIDVNKFLKEFMIQNPPTFKISERCCWGAKKMPSHNYERDNKIDLKCLGLRKAEGGIRATKLKNCFTESEGTSTYRPIFWFTDKDKKEYEQFYSVTHSKCYTDYGFKRTGCCGCPFNSKFEEDLEIIKDKEPLLYKAVNNIFGDSYAYTRAYRKFKEEKETQKTFGLVENQLSVFDIMDDEQI